MAALTDWVGTARDHDDRLDPARAAALAATLERDAPGEGAALPPLWHWIYFWDCAPLSGLGPDGHAARGGFLPPVTLAHRMWAGGRVWFHAPLSVGAPARRSARIADIQEKQGRSGRLVFVTVRHEIRDALGGAVSEEQDLVYRDAEGTPRDASPAAPGAWSRAVRLGPVMLFRYSALTFNGHRIHYDRPYAVESEGYGGLVVHGPLLATLLLDLARHEAGRKAPAYFSFRARRPVVDTAPFDLNAEDDGQGGLDLWVRDAEGAVAMTAEARTRSP